MPATTRLASPETCGSYEHQLQSSSTTKICPTSIPLQRAGSLKPADDELSARDAIDLHKWIITTIRDRDNAQEVEEFFGVSKDDYDYVLDAIDDDKLPQKLVYAAELKLLTATLPNRLHQAYLSPMGATLLGTIGSIGLPYCFGKLHVQFDVGLLSVVGDKLGVPDMLMEYKDPDGDCIPLWATEVSISQMKKSTINRLDSFMEDRKDLLAISLVDVKEVKKHSGPQEGSDAVELLEEMSSVSTFAQWLSHTPQNAKSPTVMKTFRHTWQHPVNLTITTWLCRPDGGFDIDEEDPDFFATAVNCLSLLFLIF
ncbi:hypothetical protein DFH29DRAFT_877816 [Suillus ampliporus]|nr:hypothetical protein DFH29DRAFT_877816 [Suillus ampliporus]